MNVELANLVLKEIKAHPDEWEQNSWAYRNECGTAYCFAGWAVKIARPDAVFQWRNDSHVLGVGHASTVEVGGDRFPVTLPIQDFAQQLLELNSLQATVLFAGGNHLDDLERIVDEYSKESG